MLCTEPIDEQDSALVFYEYTRKQVSLKFDSPCIESKYKLRAGDYVHLTGKLQIADSISVNDISGIVVGLENSPKDAANKIKAL